MICLSQMGCAAAGAAGARHFPDQDVGATRGLLLLVTLAIVAVLASMALSSDADTRTSLYQSLIAWAILLAIFAARALPHRKRTAAVAGPTSTTPSAAGR